VSLDVEQLHTALSHAAHIDDALAILRRLHQALALATLCDAVGVAERAETELLATGGRPRLQGLPGVASLTASERRVADLAASGASNREIAPQLYVTVKTVDVHLSSVYRKLDLKSRTQLGRVFAAEQPEAAR
jgi:DNA-binding NarL/FixJ family response regulator